MISSDLQVDENIEGSGITLSLEKRCVLKTRSKNGSGPVLSDRCDAVWKKGGVGLGRGDTGVRLDLTNTRPATLFVSNHFLPAFVKSKYLEQIPKTHSFILITGASDLTVPRQVDTRAKRLANRNLRRACRKLLRDDRIKEWYAENCDKFCRIRPIFLGVMHHDLTHLLDYTPIDFSSKKMRVLCRHRTRYWTHDRKLCNRLCRVWKCADLFTNEVPRKKFLRMIRKYTFVLCARGGGIDPCPRLFEILLCGSIPIVKTSALDNVIREMNLPIVIVKDWDDSAITTRLLREWKRKYMPYFEKREERQRVLNCLTMDHWWEYITGAKDR